MRPDQLRSMFEHAPTPMFATSGPDHVFAFVNEAYRRLIGNRDVLGQRFRDAFPSAPVPLLDLLDRVHATGERVSVKELGLDGDYGGGPEERFFNTFWQPIFDDA